MPDIPTATTSSKKQHLTYGHCHKPSDDHPLVWVHDNNHGQKHPKRAPKPTGTIYERYDQDVEKVITFRTVDPEKDLDTFTRWMNMPRVAAFWEQDWPAEKQSVYLQNLHDDTHSIPLFGEWDGVPFGYFEVYWVSEDRLSPYYEFEHFDRGFHALVGEKDYLGRRYLRLWMRALCHYIFQDDQRTQRIAIEPRSDHHALFNSMASTSFKKQFEFDFPHKRAALWILKRDDFFREQW